MIRIVCPSCHSPLGSDELEQATIDGHLSFVCPECSMVLLTELQDEAERPVRAEEPAHA
jgi:hypothetical protein